MTFFVVCAGVLERAVALSADGYQDEALHSRRLHQARLRRGPAGRRRGEVQSGQAHGMGRRLQRVRPTVVVQAGAGDRLVVQGRKLLVSHGFSDARSRRKCITYSFRKHGAQLWRISSSLMRINVGKTKLKRFMDEKPLRSADRSVKKALCKKQSGITVASDFEDTELRTCEISGELMRRAYHDPFPSSALVAAVSIIPTSVKG